VERFAQIIHPDVGIHDPDDFNVDGGFEVARQHPAMYRDACPDIQFTLEAR
jgi:hypothetical protein